MTEAEVPIDDSTSITSFTFVRFIFNYIQERFYAFTLLRGQLEMCKLDREVCFVL